MKVLFLHLSDMHFVSDSSYTKKDCEEIANAVAAKIICPISMIFLVLSGDIAFSGGAEEYNEAEKFVGELQASILGKVEIDKEKIKVLLVPGNHDRQYPEDRPDREDYESVLSRRKDEELKTYIDREFSMQKNFFEFLKREECPYGESEKFLQRKVIEHEGFSFEFNLLNTAPMSLLDADDRGLHYLPDDVLDQLQEPTAADFVITVMHHSTQNFNDSMRARLEDIVYTKSSIIFSGHDHYHATQRISYNDSQAVAVFCGGALSNKGDWRNSEFFICLFDTDSFQCDRYKCCLAQTDRGKFYKIDSEPSIVLPKKPSYGIPGNLQQNYVDAILSDAQYGVSKSVLDYFVFPRLRKEIVNEDTLETEISSFEDFIKELEQKPIRKIFKAGGTVQHRRNLFPQGIFYGFKLLLPGLLSSCGKGCVLAVKFHLTAPTRPILGFVHTLLGAVEQVNLVQSGTLAQFHDLDTQVPHGLGSAGVLHAL